MKVLIADKFEQVGVDGLKALGCEVINQPGAGANLGGALAESDPQVLVIRSTKVPGAIMDRAKNLKVIVRAGAGVDNIEVPAAAARKIAVCNTPGMNSVAVAELAMGLLISCDRRIPDQCAALKEGRWDKKGFGKSKGLKGLTLGVLGAGAIGREVIKRAQAFGMNVVAWDVVMTPERAATIGCEFGGTDAAALLALAKRCDAFTVHLPGGAETKKMFGEEFFGALKPGAYFINTSRASLVDQAALCDAVKSNGVRAGLDVYDGEPAEAEAEWSCDLASLPGVYTTHHCGASTDQAQNAVAQEVVRIVKVYKETGRVENAVKA